MSSCIPPFPLACPPLSLTHSRIPAPRRPLVPCRTLALYDEMVATNEVSCHADRIRQVSSVLKKLPACSRTLLEAVVPMLVEICEAGEETLMTASNIGICVGQSLMWPRKAEDIVKNDVPPFIAFVVDNGGTFFGPELERTTVPAAGPSSSTLAIKFFDAILESLAGCEDDGYSSDDHSAASARRKHPPHGTRLSKRTTWL